MLGGFTVGMMKSLAFSLIELMVVIAIVAILAAVAAPVYNSYISKAKMAPVESAFATLSNKSILYLQAHNVFPDFYQLRLASSPATGYKVDNPSEFLPSSYYFDPTSNIVISAGGGHCNYGTISMRIRADALNIPQATPTDFVNFDYYIFNVSGVINTYKIYEVISNGAWRAGDFFSGWHNYYSSDNIPSVETQAGFDALYTVSGCE